MICYCRPYCPDDYQQCKVICQKFVDKVEELQPAVLNMSKIHLLLHLADNLSEFGPTSAYNTERYIIRLGHCFIQS